MAIGHVTMRNHLQLSFARNVGEELEFRTTNPGQSRPARDQLFQSNHHYLLRVHDGYNPSFAKKSCGVLRTMVFIVKIIY